MAKRLIYVTTMFNVEAKLYICVYIGNVIYEPYTDDYTALNKTVEIELVLAVIKQVCLFRLKFRFLTSTFII